MRLSGRWAVLVLLLAFDGTPAVARAELALPLRLWSGWGTIEVHDDQGRTVGTLAP